MTSLDRFEWRVETVKNSLESLGIMEEAVFLSNTRFLCPAVCQEL